MYVTMWGGIYRISKRNLKRLLSDVRKESTNWNIMDYGAKWVGQREADLGDLDDERADELLHEINW